jgi:hypothetical protein
MLGLGKLTGINIVSGRVKSACPFFGFFDFLASASPNRSNASATTDIDSMLAANTAAITTLDVGLCCYSSIE